MRCKALTTKCGDSVSHVDAIEGERFRAPFGFENLSVPYLLLVQMKLRWGARGQLSVGRRGVTRANKFVCMQPRVLPETSMTTSTLDVAMPEQRKLELRGWLFSESSAPGRTVIT